MKKKDVFVFIIVVVIVLSSFVIIPVVIHFRQKNLNVREGILLNYTVNGIFADREHKPVYTTNLSRHTTEYIFIEKDYINFTLLIDLFIYSNSFEFTIYCKFNSINITYYENNNIIFNELKSKNYWKDNIEYSFSDIKINLLIYTDIKNLSGFINV